MRRSVETGMTGYGPPEPPRFLLSFLDSDRTE